MYDNEEYGGFRPFQMFRSQEGKIAHLENAINKIMSKKAQSPRDKRKLADLVGSRDRLLVKAAARRGAEYAAGIPGTHGGIAGAGIRGDAGLIEREFGPEVVGAHNLEQAQQGQRFQAVVPPGSGRLISIPFVLAATPTVPVVNLVTAAGLGATQNLVTVANSWAVLQIVGLQTQSAIVGANTATGLMQDLRIGGSANLFMSEDWIIMDEFDVDSERYGGLRAYPVLRSPNTGLISLNSWASGVDVLQASVLLICETLRDDSFGPGLPGPYGR